MDYLKHGRKIFFFRKKDKIFNEMTLHVQNLVNKWNISHIGRILLIHY